MKLQRTHLVALWQVLTYLQELSFAYFTVVFSLGLATPLCLTPIPAGRSGIKALH